jgi:hypothetical protein
VLTTPGQLAGALAAELPPEEVPPATTQPGGLAARTSVADDYWGNGQLPPSRTDYRRQPPPRRSSGARLAVIGALVLVVIVGAAAATTSFWHKGSTPHSSTSPSSHPTTKVASKTSQLTPVAAKGFDADNPNGDAQDENSSQAPNILNHNPQGWSSQQYDSATLGGLKPGTGLIFDMGKSVRLSSVTVQFGKSMGADVEVQLGDSSVRSKANEASMTTVASANGIGGSYTFHVTSKATGRYLVLWFTKLPPIPGGKFMAQVYSISVTGPPAPS